MNLFEYNRRYLEAGIDQLENYLLSGDIYRPIGIKAPASESPYPQLTLGWVLLAYLKAEASLDTAAEHAEFQRLKTKLEAIQTHWRTAWGNKALAEFQARLRLWRDFLEELRDNPSGNFDRYPYEVNRRVLLELLKQQVAKLPPEDQEMLSGLDRILRAVFKENEFIWEKKLQPGFPKSTFWYLYGTPELSKGDQDR